MMKICFVGLETLPLPPVKGGAIERIIHELTGHLSDEGVEVHIISIGDENLGAEAVNTKGNISYHYVAIPGIIRNYPFDRLGKGVYYFKQVGVLIREIKPDIVHYHNYPAAVLIGSLGYKHRFKNILHMHNLDYGWNFMAKRLDKFLFKAGFSKVDAIITCSSFVKNFMLDKYPFLKNKDVSVLLNGVNVDIFKLHNKEQVRKEYNLNNEPIILFLGRIDHRKGLHILLESFKQVRGNVKNAKLIIVGPMGSYWHTRPQEYALKIKEQAQNIGGVLFLEPVYDQKKLARILSVADIACVPSVFQEGLGMVSLELQACGVPVIVSNTGGLPETVVNKKTGLVIEQDSVTQLEEAIMFLLKNKDVREEMGRNARDFIVNNFSWAKITKRLLTKYSEIIRN